MREKMTTKHWRLLGVTGILMPLGMAGAVLYFMHVFVGQYLWKEYNWITTDISTLTAVGSPNARLLSIFALLSGVSQMLFFLGMTIRASRIYHRITTTGYLLLFTLQLVSTFGYTLFPLESDKTVMTFSNLMHIIVTVVGVLLLLSSLYILSFGYLKREKLQKTGMMVLAFAVVITLTGVLNPVGMANDWNKLGVTERLNIFSFEILIFILSYVYTFQRKR